VVIDVEPRRHREGVEDPVKALNLLCFSAHKQERVVPVLDDGARMVVGETVTIMPAVLGVILAVQYLVCF
jgi:hypothetical protein